MSNIKAALFVFIGIFESALLGVGLLVLSPFFFIRQFWRLKDAHIYLCTLLPMGLLAQYLRAQLLFKVGNLRQGMILLGQAIRKLEKDFEPVQDLDDSTRGQALILLYEDLLKAYIRSGRFDDAMNLVIKAHSVIGVDHLPSFSELSVQTSHIIKAGLAAGRLLDEGGFRDLLSSGKPIVIKSNLGETSPEASPADPPKVGPGKILPFRRPQPE